MTTNVFDQISVGKLGTMLFTPEAGYAAPARPNRLLAAFTRWRQSLAAQRELSALSDRELADVGITRAQIPTLIRTGRI